MYDITKNYYVIVDENTNREWIEVIIESRGEFCDVEQGMRLLESVIRLSKTKNSKNLFFIRSSESEVLGKFYGWNGMYDLKRKQSEGFLELKLTRKREGLLRLI